MNEEIFLVSFVIGAMIAVTLMSQIFTSRKSSFFLGLVVLVLTFEILFSWGAVSGYNNSAGAFPIHLLLNYLIIPPALSLFVNYQTDDNFKFQAHHLFLFLPALIALFFQLLSYTNRLNLMDYSLWVGFAEYLPMVWLIYVIGRFWFIYFRQHKSIQLTFQKKVLLTQVRLLALMVCLTILCLFWLSFTIVGWEHYAIIEYTIIVLFFGLAFINFLEGQTFPSIANKKEAFSQYNDKDHLTALTHLLQEKQLFLNPNLPLKTLAAELKLPSRYVSYLINKHHQKNYKEYINQFRIEAFLSKAQSGEQDYKTLLSLALESGFSSKSTFNLVFKKHLGKSPSEYLKNLKEQENKA